MAGKDAGAAGGEVVDAGASWVGAAGLPMPLAETVLFSPLQAAAGKTTCGRAG